MEKNEVKINIHLLSDTLKVQEMPQNIKKRTTNIDI